MIDNYVQEEFQHWHEVYVHPQTKRAIFIGDVKAAQNLNFLFHEHIGTVITAALGMDHLDYSQYELKHIVYPLLDHKAQNIGQFFDQFYQIIERRIRCGSILVHCSAGISRSSTLVLSYLMKKENWSFRQACQFVRKRRPQILPNLGFQRQLKMYEVQLRDQVAYTPRSLGNQVKTSENKRQRILRSLNHEQPSPILSLVPMKSTPHVVNTRLKGSSPKKLDFNIRAIKLRMFEPRSKTNRRINNTMESKQEGPMNFDVVKVNLESRVARRPHIVRKMYNFDEYIK